MTNGGIGEGAHPLAETGRRLIVAVQFLTVLPMPALTRIEAGDFGRSSVFFPLVGAGVGLAVALAMAAGGAINPAVAGLAGMLAWVGITGALHLDGLGDVADGFGAAHGDPERFRAVLHDPHAGNFAVTAIALQVAAKLVLLGSLAAESVDKLWVLPLVPAWARWGAMVWARALPALWRGSGESFAAGIAMPAVVLWGAGLAAAGLWIAPSLLTALILVPLIGAFWRWRLGGISGDCLGASIELAESALLLALLAGPA